MVSAYCTPLKSDRVVNLSSTKNLTPAFLIVVSVVLSIRCTQHTQSGEGGHKFIVITLYEKSHQVSLTSVVQSSTTAATLAVGSSEMVLVDSPSAERSESETHRGRFLLHAPTTAGRSCSLFSFLVANGGLEDGQEIIKPIFEGGESIKVSHLAVLSSVLPLPSLLLEPVIVGG